MDDNKKPHSREKRVAEGSAQVRKGKKAATGGPVGSGGRGGAAGGQRSGSASGGRASGGRASGGKAASGLGLLGAFFALPKKVRKIVLLLLAVVVVVVLVKSCMGGQNPLDGLLSGLTPGVTDPVLPVGGDEPGGGAADSAADHTVADGARAKRVAPLGGGQDTVTVMVYMCGTDLESKYGMGTKDIQEMVKADLSDKVNVILETGGCKKWNNNIVSNETNQIYKVENGGLRMLEEDLGAVAMTDPDNLTDFIQYCAKNYPADRNVLIFWDHGGGTLSGYGYDEKFSNSSSMTLTEVDSALKKGGCVFDWVGFDACLMATLETALVCEQYADYLIASEETEPGTGWYYTDWLTRLSENTSVPTVELAELLIDDFVETSTAASARAQVTLSVIDLAELRGTVPPAFRAFSTSTTELLDGDDYARVSDARAGARQFAQSSRINQVDLIDLARRVGTTEGTALADALSGCVKYNNSTVSRAYGVSIYFPYESLSSMNGAVSTYDQLGMDEEYTKCIQSFASMEQGGQIAASSAQSTGLSGLDAGSLLGSLLEGVGASGGSSASPLGSLLGSFTNSSGSASAGSGLNASSVLDLLSAFSGRSMPEALSWLDADRAARAAEYVAGHYIDPGRIALSEKAGRRVLSLTAEEWALIQTVELNVFVDDGAGYIDLGLDNVFAFDGDDLLLDYDHTWLTVDGAAAAYYLVSDTEEADGSYTTVGRIPALLNGEAVNLRVVFDAAHPAGVVTGAYPLYDGETDTQAKGDIPLAAGDSVQLLCDYYGYDGSYSASYELGDPLTVGAGGLTLANRDLGETECSVTYRLTDIYGNRYWTPAFTD